MGLIDEYIAHGWSLCTIKEGTKHPGYQGWEMKQNALKQEADLLTHYGYKGVGLLHAHSGTCSIDVDDWHLTLRYIPDLEALFNAPDAVHIVSGKPGHGKLLYQMPFKMVLPMKKFTEEVVSPITGKSRRVTAFELRCGSIEGGTVQCVLPPTVHPDTQQPYTWGGSGDWRRLPWLPPHILELWERSLVDIRPPCADGVESSWEEIEEAIAYIDPACPRDEWIRVGMALHKEGVKTYNPDRAFKIWDEWSKSQNCAKYNPREMRGQWASFRTTKNITVSLGTLFKYAREGGWPGKRIDASTLFGPTSKPATPTDIMSLLRPDPPDIDLDLFPEVLARRALEVSETVGCDPLVPLWAGLGAVCGAIDARTRLELTHGFKVPPVLWLMTLGDPGDKKSPGSKPMIDALADIEASDRQRFARDAQEWEMKEAVWAGAKKANLEYLKSSSGMLDPTQAPPHPGDMPTKPVPLKITVMDVTSQKLMHLAAERPRGLLCYLDEMNGWIGKMVNRMSGDDRSSWVKSYEAVRHEVDRVGHEPIRAENLAVAIYGNCQPRVLEENYKSLTEDGLLQRFVPAILRHEQTRLSQPIPEMLTSASTWDNLLRQTYALTPRTYRLSPDAYKVFRAFQEWYEVRKRKERLVSASPTFMTAFGKSEGLVGRLTLVFHVMERPFADEVSVDTIERAVRFVKGYVIPAYRYLFDKEGGSRFDLWVTEHIIHYSDSPGITMKDIKRSARRPFDLAGIKNPQEQGIWILNAMALLESKDWVKRLDDGSQEIKGVAEWLINPYLKDVFADYRKQVIAYRLERDQDRLVKANLAGSRSSAIHGAELVDVPNVT